MFSSRGICQVRRTGFFADILQVKGTVEVNDIVPVSGSAVNVEGYTNVDDLAVVNINLSEGDSLTSEVFVADRDYEVLAIKEIHVVAGQAGSTAVIRILSADGTTTLLANNILLDGANDTVQTAVLEPIVNVNKGQGLRIQRLGDISGLSGCVITVVLKQL